MSKTKIYRVLPLIRKGDVFAAPTEPIVVLAIETKENCFNVYVEKPNFGLKFITGLNKKKGGPRVTNSVLKEFAEACATDELVERADAGEKSVEYCKLEGIGENVGLAREMIFGENNSLFQ